MIDLTADSIEPSEELDFPLRHGSDSFSSAREESGGANVS